MTKTHSAHTDSATLLRMLDGGTAATYRVAGFELAMTMLAGVALARDARALGGRHS